jgi:hypothetical protein
MRRNGRAAGHFRLPAALYGREQLLRHDAVPSTLPGVMVTELLMLRHETVACPAGTVVCVFALHLTWPCCTCRRQLEI